MTLDRNKLIATLVVAEGQRSHPYDDTTGHTFRVGDTLCGNLTIGIGHNLMTGLSEAAQIFLLNEDIGTAIGVVTRIWPQSEQQLNSVRYRALVELAFNLGERLASFSQFLSALQTGDYERAAQALTDSEWHQQVHARSMRIEAMIRTGVDALIT